MYTDALGGRTARKHNAFADTVGGKNIKIMSVSLDVNRNGQYQKHSLPAD